MWRHYGVRQETESAKSSDFDNLHAVVAPKANNACLNLPSSPYLVCLRRSSRNSMSKPHDGKNIHFVDPPHPNWKPGDKLSHKLGSDNYIGLKPEELGSDLYPALISAVCPRPIGFVCCLNSKGQRNLSPYSYFNVMNHDPALCVLGANRSAQREGGGMKDFEQYVRETG